MHGHTCWGLVWCSFLFVYRRAHAHIHAHARTHARPPPPRLKVSHPIVAALSVFRCLPVLQAFSATGAVEGINAIQTGELLVLSEQELVDCDTITGNAGEGLLGLGLHASTQQDTCNTPHSVASNTL